MPEKIEIYEGELMLSCHRITQLVAEKAGLTHKLPLHSDLEKMADAMKKILIHNNPDKEIVFIRKEVPGERPPQ